jgi:low affinity Fe/Cu permease
MSLAVENKPFKVWLCASIAQAIHSICQRFFKYSPIASLVFSTSTCCHLKLKVTLSQTVLAFIQNSFSLSYSQTIASL